MRPRSPRSSGHDDDWTGNRALAFAEGLLVVAILGGLDVVWGEGHIVIATVVLGPFIASLAATPRQTAVVAGVASAVALASGTWNHDFDQGDFYVRLAAVG